MSDVVAKLDAWLKSHNQGAYEDYVEDAVCDIIGVREELEEVAQQYPKLACKCEEQYCRGDFDLRALINNLNSVCEGLNLALDARVRAS